MEDSAVYVCSEHLVAEGKLTDFYAGHIYDFYARHC
jgi:hypothetical protein